MIYLGSIENTKRVWYGYRFKIIIKYHFDAFMDMDLYLSLDRYRFLLFLKESIISKDLDIFLNI